MVAAFIPVGAHTDVVRAAASPHMCPRCAPPPYRQPPPPDKPLSLSLAPTESAGSWDLGTLTDGDALPPGGSTGYTVVVNWGDQTVSSGRTVLKYAWYMNVPNVFEVLATHTYAAPGAYTVTVTVSDPGQSVTASATVG